MAATETMPNLLLPPSRVEILCWLNSCNPTFAEMYSDAVTFYCMGLRERFSFWPPPTVEELNEITDIWIQGLVEQRSFLPSRMECILGMPPMCLGELWVCSNMGNTLWEALLSDPGNPRFVPNGGLLYAYLVWRYELKTKELSSLAELTEFIGNVSLDG